jgi:polysaccharide biosynthesis/export protein
MVALATWGCATSSPATAPAPYQPESVAAPAPVDDGGSLKVTRLDQLWQSRRTGGVDFPIGTGDIIAVSVPGLSNDTGAGTGAGSGDVSGSGSAGGSDQALGNWTVRVNGMGNIDLPLLGRIHVAGLNEEQLRTALTQRLQKYMYDPQVEISVKSYNSRQAALSGEVHSPGMYTIYGPNETIRDLIMLAGGTTDNAAQKILLTPSPVKAGSHPGSGGPATPQSDANTPGSQDPDVMAAANASGVGNHATYVINLAKGHSQARYLDIPVRPGDTIYVPRAGSATVVGWVHSPKTIDITPGLTVLNAISQAGGPLFAADTDDIKVLRQGAGHETKTVVVNLNDIKDARAPDMLVQANDVIDVTYSPVRIPGYAIYYGMQGLVNFAPAALIFGGVP